MRLKPVAGIACGFDARRRNPAHNYSIVAPTAGEFESHAAKRPLQRYLPKQADLAEYRDLWSCATSHWKRRPLQNLAGDRIDANLLMMFCILKQDLPHRAPAHLLQAGIERATVVGVLGRLDGLSQRDFRMFQCR
jgi:hypothetical protein